MPSVGSLTTLAAGLAKRAEVNSNFSTIRTAVNDYAAWVDLTATITGAWTFTTSPIIPNALTVGTGLTVTAGGVTVSAGGITVTGNSTITGTLGGLTGLTVASGGIAVTAGASTFGAAVTVTGTCTATLFSGSGASLTSLPAANITGTLPAISGANLTSLNASNLASGTVPEARLPGTLANLAISTAFSMNNSSYIEFTETTGTLDALKIATGYWTADAPAASTTRYLRVTLAGVAYRIKLESVA